MGASVGIGALIMGVTLLSVFAIATTLITNQAEVALEISDPDVIDKPELSLTNIANSGSVQSLNIVVQGGNYYPGNLDFTGTCDILPTGTFSVSSESWTLQFNENENGANYLQTYFSFQELDDESGTTTDWYVWFDIDGADIAPSPLPSGIGIEVEIVSGELITDIRDAAFSAIDVVAALDQIGFVSPPAPPGDTIQASYLQSGPAANIAVSNPLDPFSVLVSNDGGVINSVNLLDGGTGCTSTPTIVANAGPFPGSSGQVGVSAMEWDYSFDITNTGDSSIKLAEIFSTINGGSTEVLSSTPAFTFEYIFPGERISIIKDANSIDTLTRVAISSHGMNIALEA